MSVTITHQHLASTAGVGHWDKRDVKDVTPAFRKPESLKESKQRGFCPQKGWV